MNSKLFLANPRNGKGVFGFRWQVLHGPNSVFLTGTLLLTLTAAPFYVVHEGLALFQVVLFLLFFVATGLSLTLGYHRLFAHRSFQAAWPVRLFTLIFGAAAFENSVLCWAADHRRHHKFVDKDEDPYDISKGFLYAHIGWILFRWKPETSMDYVKDLEPDRLVQWQHRYYYAIAILTSFVLPMALGGIWGGWSGALGSLLLAGVARIVCVHHMTFFINSLCHSIGRQPYSRLCTARDSAIMALLTFGEGYHNFHHAFQHDYRNGAKPWQFDPTKWSVWLLNKAGFAWQLRRVPVERIRLAEICEQQRQLAEKLSERAIPLAESIRVRLHAAQAGLQQAYQNWESREMEYRKAVEKQLDISKEKLAALRREFQEAKKRVRAAMRDWRETHRLVLAQFTSPAAAL